MHDMPKNFKSAKEPLTSVENRKTLRGQDPYRPIDFILANPFIKKDEQPFLKKTTTEKLFENFGMIMIAENEFYIKPMFYLVFENLMPHWLCGFVEAIRKESWLYGFSLDSIIMKTMKNY